MTSTNDGKDVKSNQTSGQRGKTYYIELYKSLEAHLNEECPLRARNEHVCEAWRRVHSLCQHSAPKTLAHLLAWLQRHTARTVLHTEWPKSKDEHKNLEEAIQSFIQESETAIAGRNGTSPTWESNLMQRGEWFKKILANPWGHPVLKVLLDPQGKTPSDKEVLEWLKEERGVVFVTRLRQLAASKCDDLALILASDVMNRVRAATVDVSDVEQSEGAKDNTRSEGAEPTFAEKLKTEAGFTEDVWALLTDLEFVLLHKWDKQSQCIALAKKTPLRYGYQLVERLRCRLETSPREKKLWKNAKDAATLIAQVVVARCMVVPVCAGAARDALRGCARALAALLSPARLAPTAAALAAPAATASHLYALADAVHEQSTEEMKPFVCELYVRAITAGLNELEKLKMKTEKEADARLAERTLSSWFTALGALLADSVRVHCECSLTAFSVHPAPALYERLQRAPALPPLPSELNSKEETKSEFGSWANDSRSQTNLVKTSETLNLKQTQQRANVLSTAIFAEGEALGLSAELCQDLAVCLSGPRVKTLSWDMDRQQLLANCRLHMERTDGGTRALSTELRFLNLDPSAYRHLPEEDDDENDLYYGIEKGYEHLVEFQEPEEVWEFDPERTESASSNLETESYVVKRHKKKKHKKLSVSEESDPLSLDAETNRTEKKKERPHSKERSKERRKKKSEKDPDDKECEKLKDPSQRKEKKKQRKAKREKEIPPPEERKPGSLSCLIGMKVIKPVEKKAESETKLAACITDSDYDSQGKSSMNSEANDPSVIFDGLFSMDDYKSPERNNPIADKQVLMKNNELSLVHGQVTVNNLPKAVSKLNLDKTQSLSSKIVSTQPAVMPPSTVVKTVSDGSHLQHQQAAKVNTVREEVKRSITKLLEFRRQKLKQANEQMLNSTSNNNQSVPSNKHLNIEQRSNAIVTPECSLQSFTTSTPITVPEIPKVYINKTQTDKLNQLKQEVNNLLNITKGTKVDEQHIQDRVNVKQHVPISNKITKTSTKDSGFVDTTTNYIDILKIPSYKNRVVPSSSGYVDQTNILNNINQLYRHPQNYDVLCQQYSTLAEPTGQKIQDFLKELQETINAGTGCKTLEKSLPSNSNVNVKKEMRPISRVTPIVPNTGVKIERIVTPPCAKQIVHQKKVENAPNTFSRLSYMHKNKQSDAKQKQLDMSLRQDQLIKENSLDLARSIAENKVANVRCSQNKGSPVNSRDARIKYAKHGEVGHANRKTPKHSTVSKDHPLISNILQSNSTKQSNVNFHPISQVTREDNLTKNILSHLEQPTVITSLPTKTSYLSEKDQNDLILLLRQQSRINANRYVSKTTTSTNKTVNNSQPPINNANDMLIRNNTTYKPTFSIQTNTVQQYEGQKLKTATLPNINISEVIKNNSSTRIIENKQTKVIKPVVNSSKIVDYDKNITKNTVTTIVENPKSESGRLEQKTSSLTTSPQDWLSVMNAIRAQKTPSRGSNALEMALKKDSENSLRHQRIVRTTSLGDKNIKTTNVSHINQTQYKFNTTEPVTSSVPVEQINITKDITRIHQNDIKTKPVDNMSKTTHIEPYRKLPCEQKKQSTLEMTQQKDPFISGLENSDYDLLEELMDDELRQEIGELSSDEDSFRGTSLQKNTKNNSTKISANITKQTASCPQKPKVGIIESKSNQNISSRLQKSSEVTVQRSTTKVSVLKNNYSSKPVMESSVRTCSPLTTNKNISLHYVGKETNKVSHNIPTSSNTVIQQCKKSNEAMSNIRNDRTSYVNKDNIITPNQTLEPKNMCINAGTQQSKPALQNVVLIGSEMFYDSYSAIQTQIQPGFSSVDQTPYVPNMTLYHSTQFAAPVVSPVIIGNALTGNVPINIQSNPVISNNLSRQPCLTLSTNVDDRNKAGNDVNTNTKLNLRSGSDSLLQDNTNQKLDDKMTLDINSNKNCERKVLSEVQEKQDLAAIEKINNKITKIQKLTTDMLKDPLKIQVFDDLTRVSKNQKMPVDSNLLKDSLNDQDKTDDKRIKLQRSNDNYIKEPIKVQVINDSINNSRNQTIYANVLRKEPLLDQGKINTKILTNNQILPNDNDVKIKSLKINKNDDSGRTTVHQNISSNKNILEESLKEQENNDKHKLKENEIQTQSVRDGKDLERLKNKRLAIITREINHCSYYPSIPLTYIPINIENKSESATKNKNQDNKNKAHSAISKKIESNKRKETNVSDTSDLSIESSNYQSLSNELSEENNSIPIESHRILLRSSNKNIDKILIDMNIPKGKNSKVRLKSNVTKTGLIDKKAYGNKKTSNLKEKKRLVVTKRTSKRIIGKKAAVKSNVDKKSLLKNNVLNQTSCEKDSTDTESHKDCTAAKPENQDIEDELLASKIPNTRLLENIDLPDNEQDVIAQQLVNSVLPNILENTKKNKYNKSTASQSNQPKMKRGKKAIIKNKLSVENKINTEASIDHEKVHTLTQKQTSNILLPVGSGITNSNLINLESSTNKNKNLLLQNNIQVTGNKDKRKNCEIINRNNTEYTVSNCKSKQLDEIISSKAVGLSDVISVRGIIDEKAPIISNTLGNKKEDSDIIKKIVTKAARKGVHRNKDVIKETVNIPNKLTETKEINKLEKLIDNKSEDSELPKNIKSLLCNENIDLTYDDNTNAANEKFMDCVALKSLQIPATTKKCWTFSKQSLNPKNKPSTVSHTKNDSEKLSIKQNNLDQVVSNSNDHTKQMQSVLSTSSNQPHKVSLSSKKAKNPQIKPNFDTDMNLSSIPESIRNKIIVEEMPTENTNERNKKCVRIKLPNGKVFKATVFGKLLTDYESLFSEPSLKSLLLSNMSDNNRYTLNIKQVTKPNKEDPSKPAKTHIEDIQMYAKKTVSKEIETINLLSDDEDDTTSFVFKTEFGSYKTTLTNKNIYEKHQSRFVQKSCIKLNRYIPKEIDTEQHLDIYSSNDKSAGTGSQEISTSGIQVISSLNAFAQTQCAEKTKCVEIDESSNDSIDLLKNCPNLSIDVMSVAKETVNQLQEIGITDSLEKHKINENDSEFDKFTEENSTNVNETICEKEEISMPPAKTQDSVVTLPKCNNPVNRHLGVNDRHCFVKLVRCDELIKNVNLPYLSKKPVTNYSNSLIMDAEDFIPASIVNRSVLLSVPNKASKYGHDIVHNKTDFKILRSTSPVIDVFETIARLGNYVINTKEDNRNQACENIFCKSEWFITKHQLYLDNISHCANYYHEQLDNRLEINSDNTYDPNEHIVLNQEIPQHHLNFVRKCDWYISKRELYYNELFTRTEGICERRKTIFKSESDRSKNENICAAPLENWKVPSLKSILTLYFQIIPLTRLKWPANKIPENQFLKTHNLKRKSAASGDGALATKIAKNSVNERQSYSGVLQCLDYDNLHNAEIVKTGLQNSDNYLMNGSLGNENNIKCVYEGKSSKSNAKEDDDEAIRIDTTYKLDSPQIKYTTSQHDYHDKCLDKREEKTFSYCCSERSSTYIAKEKNFMKEIHRHNFDNLANPYKSIENVKINDKNLYDTSTKTVINEVCNKNQSSFHSIQNEQSNRKIIVEVNIEKIDMELTDNKSTTEEEQTLIKDCETQIIVERTKNPNCSDKHLSDTMIENNSERNSGKSRLLDNVNRLQNKESQNETLYSILGPENTSEVDITNINNEQGRQSRKSESITKFIPSNKKLDKDNLSQNIILETNGNNYDKNGYEKIMLLCKENPNLVLEGIEYEDPVVGSCYVFPVPENGSNSNEDNICESDEDINSCNDTQLKVLVPKITYSKFSQSDIKAVEELKVKKNLKRKTDVVDSKISEKKYRKGKNIDYPKITAAAIIESGYSKEYKLLFDYYSSLKFSLSRSFFKEHIDVYSLIKDWPIESSSSESAEICHDNVEPTLFLNSDYVHSNYNVLNQTLSEEISIKYNDNDSLSVDENETNFKMGFGERSGRVIQNLGEIDDFSKVSAATLSDVKQPQPFLFSGEYDDDVYNTNAIRDDQVEKIRLYISNIKLHDKVQSFFKKTIVELKKDFIKESSKDKLDSADYSFDLFYQGFMDPSPIDTIVQVVQVGQLPVSAAAQNPVTCDPRVTQVSNASPSQCSVENSPRDDSQTAIKTEYTELTTANLTLPLVQDYAQHNQSITIESHETSNSQTTDENIPIETEIKSVVKIELMEEIPEEKDEIKELHENNESQNVANKHLNNVDYVYDTNNSNTALDDSNIQVMYNTSEKQNVSETFSQQNGGSEKTDQIAHAMNAAGITTTTETIANTRAHALVNILSQKIRQGAVASGNTQSTTNNYSKTTSINAMALQQALAQILPPPLNQTNMSENNTQTTNTQVAPQVLHIVQGKNATGSQITLVDNSQQSVISNPSATPVLHIVQNKSGTTGVTANGASGTQPNTFSGLSLVDTGLQQGGNQLLHIVNTGSQKNNNTGQLLKRVNLLTNLANVQGSNDQKMVQFVCKSADGKAIQLNAPHQRSMVLRLQPIETSNVQANQAKAVEPQDLNTTQSVTGTLASKDNINAQQEIKSRSVYEENYAKFIQNSSSKPTVPEKSTSLPKFNQAFGKPVFQDGNQKPNEINSNNSHLSSITSSENTEIQPTTDNSVNLDHIGQINSPPLLLRKSPAQTSQAQQNLVQQIKQTIAPMNIQTMHGGVIYTRQIPVNIGGGQTINLITVPSTELIDDSGQKQSTDVKFVNQGDIEPSIIKIVPQSQTASNSDISTEDNNAHLGVSNDNVQNQQPQPVLTQMRIKLPMLSKTPQMVSGARVVRPSFFQIQRNVIGGANQPVYQQLVLTAAPPLGQQTIRLPQAQATRQIKVPTESQSSTESHMSSSTLEQLREFDMVLEQVKERSTVQPNSNTFTKLHTPSTDTTDNVVSVSSAPTESTQVLYSIGNNQPLNVAYVNRKTTVTTPNTPAFVRSPDSSGIVDSPTSSTHVQIPHTVTTEISPNETANQPKPAKVGSKSKSRPKSSHPPSSMKINNVPPKTSAQKPLEDEQTTQRILYILAEYKEQVENSPDKDKPAPRRRSNPPSNPSGSSKRKKSSSSSRRPGVRDLSPVHGDDTCRTMGSEDSSCGTSQGDCNESCLESHSPQDSPRKVVRKLTFEQETPAAQPRPQPQRNVIVADGQTITVARGTTGKPATAVLMPANYILPVSMVKGGQQIAIVTNRGPKLLTVGGGEGGATNALLLQRLIGPAGLKPVLARPGVRHVRLPTAALHNLQAFNLATATTVQPPDSTASPAPAATPPELVETRATNSPWTDRESQEVKPERGSSPEGSEPWNLPSSADPHDYTYEETVRADNMDRTVLDPIPDRYSPDMEAQRIFDKMFDVDSKKSYIVDSHDDSPRGGYDIDASDCDDKAYHQVVQKKDGSSHRQHRLTHVSAAALRHKYAILEHELRLQKSLSEECEDLGVDSPSASDLFPEAELLFAASPAHDHTQDHCHQSHTPQPTLLNQSGIPQPDIDDQIATDQLLPREPMERQDLNLGFEDVGIVTVSEDGMQATIALDQEEFARSHPNTTFHSEPTDETEVHPFTIAGLKGRHITSTIFHSNRAPATVLMTTPQATVISQAAAESNSVQNVKYSDIDNMIHSLPSSHSNNINLSSVLVKDDGLTRFDSILNDSRELHLTNTASAIVHSGGNATQVIRRICYDDDKRDRDSRFLMDEPEALIAGDDAKMMAEDSSRDATLESIGGDVDDDGSSPERHTELFWESNSASERSESRRPLDFSSDSDKCCKSPSGDETNSTDSSTADVTVSAGGTLRLASVIKAARAGRDSADGSSDDAPPRVPTRRNAACPERRAPGNANRTVGVDARPGAAS